MNTISKEKSVFTPADIAAEMGLSLISVYKLLHSREDPIPSKRVNGRYFILRSNFESWLNNIR